MHVSCTGRQFFTTELPEKPSSSLFKLTFWGFFFCLFYEGFIVFFFFLRFIQRDTYSTETFGIFIVMYYNYKLKLIYIK